jgi:hypothetical protein
MDDMNDDFGMIVGRGLKIPQYPEWFEDESLVDCLLRCLAMYACLTIHHAMLDWCDHYAQDSMSASEWERWHRDIPANMVWLENARALMMQEAADLLSVNPRWREHEDYEHYLQVVHDADAYMSMIGRLLAT